MHTELTPTEIAALQSDFLRATGETFTGRDDTFLALANALEETGSCEIPSHLTISGRPEIVTRAELVTMQESHTVNAPTTPPSWYALRAYNTETQYGYGTPAEAEAFVDRINATRETNMFSASALTIKEALSLRLEGPCATSVGFDFSDSDVA